MARRTNNNKGPCTLVTVRLKWTELRSEKNEFECTFSTKESKDEVGKGALAAAKSELGGAAKKALNDTIDCEGNGRWGGLIDQLVLEAADRTPDGNGGMYPRIWNLLGDIVRKEAALAKRERRPPSRKLKDQSGVAHRVVLRVPWKDGEVRRMVASASQFKRCREWIKRAERKLWTEVVANPGDWQYLEASNSFRHRTDELAKEALCHGEEAMPLVHKTRFAVSVDGYVALRARKAVKEEEERKRKEEEEEQRKR